MPVVVGVVVDLLGRLVGLLERKLNAGQSPSAPLSQEDLEDLQRQARELRNMKDSN